MQTIELPPFYTETCAQRPADHRDAIILYRDKHTETCRPWRCHHSIQRQAHRDLQIMEMPSFYTETSTQRPADHRDAIILYRDKRTETCRPWRCHNSIQRQAHRDPQTIEMPSFYTETSAQRYVDHTDGIILQTAKRTESETVP